MKIRLQVVDREGGKHTVETVTGRSLMEALRELDYGVAAICGGLCSCATCHVIVAQEWSDRLPARGSDERELLAALSRGSADSRLACQIPLCPELDGLQLTLAPEE